jgi:hypothetical protein
MPTTLTWAWRISSVAASLSMFMAFRMFSVAHQFLLYADRRTTKSNQVCAVSVPDHVGVKVADADGCCNSFFTPV